MNPPRLLHIAAFFDSCAFDGGFPQESGAAKKVLELLEQESSGVQLVHSVLKEIDYPRTPQKVKAAALQCIQSLEVPLQAEEIPHKKRIEAIILGNGSREKMKSDAEHVFLAFRNHANYFVTVDNRLLKKSAEIYRYTDSLKIVRPSELLDVIGCQF